MSEFLFAVDPGKVTGWSWWKVGDAEPVTGEDEFDPFCSLAEGWLETHGRDTLVIVESFIVTPQTAKKSQAPWSLEVIGVLRWLASKYRAGFEMQKPSEAKSFVSNERLRKVGWWHRGGEGHARDALRHLLLAGVRHRVVDPATLL